MKDLETQRLNKRLAVLGLASRREADELIAKGLVWVNGQKAALGQQVAAGDQIEVRRPDPTYHYALYHKPRGEEMKEVYAWQGAELQALGRLDKESRGLLLLSDDRRLPSRLLDPEYGHPREYVVEVDKHLSPSFARLLSAGIDIEGYHTQPAEVTILDDRTFKIVMREGKKHQIRRMCSALGFQVTDLLRTRISNLRLGNQKPGSARELRPVEKTKLLETLGLTQSRSEE